MSQLETFLSSFSPLDNTHTHLYTLGFVSPLSRHTSIHVHEGLIDIHLCIYTCGSPLYIHTSIDGVHRRT
ncbi:hypothetical protein CSUI_004794 [Cystoisospora suis]|uniref:Uncharacterized protein n=1 Tax=Cystoisospora suis TaxID=483139 RepID=A0A2C6L079_9APIC|nr:hypothetical protein CSUI_004794 [Cystoisospora suis]